MQKIFLVLIILSDLLVGRYIKEISYRDLYIGFDIAINAFGTKSDGNPHSTDTKHYDVDSAFSYKIGYEINDLVSIEYTHYRFNNEDFENINEDMLGFEFFMRDIFDKRWFNAKDYYLSFGVGVIGANELNGNLHYKFSKNLEAILSHRYLIKDGIHFGGVSESIRGTYLGVRYIFD
jgi:hypothetical protein